MKKQTKQGRLITLLKESGLDEPSADFSQRLAQQVVTSHAYRPSHTAAYQKKNGWVKPLSAY